MVKQGGRLDMQNSSLEIHFFVFQYAFLNFTYHDQRKTGKNISDFIGNSSQRLYFFFVKLIQQISFLQNISQLIVRIIDGIAFKLNFMKEKNICYDR